MRNNSCESILYLGKFVKEEMPFKDISYLELWQPFCSVEPIHLCNFGKPCYEEQFCRSILNLGQTIRRKCSLKIHVFVI